MVSCGWCGAGIGTIVGSSVFNVAFVHSICGLISPMPIVLSWWATLRDVIFYSLSLSCLIIFYLDHYVEWWEALILHACYVSFVTFMKFNKRLEAWVKTHIASKFSHTFSLATACCDQLEIDAISTGSANLPVNGHHRANVSVTLPLLHWLPRFYCFVKSVLVVNYLPLGLTTIKSLRDHFNFKFSLLLFDFSEPCKESQTRQLLPSTPRPYDARHANCAAYDCR